MRMIFSFRKFSNSLTHMITFNEKELQILLFHSLKALMTAVLHLLHPRHLYSTMANILQ